MILNIVNQKLPDIIFFINAHPTSTAIFPFPE